MNRFTPRFRINTTALIYAWKPLAAASSSHHRRINTSDNLFAALRCVRLCIFGIVSKKYKSRVSDWNVNSANGNKLACERIPSNTNRMQTEKCERIAIARRENNKRATWFTVRFSHEFNSTFSIQNLWTSPPQPRTQFINSFVWHEHDMQPLIDIFTFMRRSVLLYAWNNLPQQEWCDSSPTRHRFVCVCVSVQIVALGFYVERSLFMQTNYYVV